MSDITKCLGGKCKRKKKCYRYTAKDSKFQSYFVLTPLRKNKCEYFWGENESKKRTTDKIS